MSTHKYLDSTGLGQVWGKIKDYVDDNAGGSDQIMYVTFTYISEDPITGVPLDSDDCYWESDKTYSEISTHITNGGMVYGIDGTDDGEARYYDLDYYDSETISFSRIGIFEEETESYGLSINSDDSVSNFYIATPTMPVQSDWNENDSTDSSYIANRPVYYEDNGDSDNDLTCIVYERPFTMPVGTNLLDIGEIDEGNLNMYYSILVGGKTKIVYANGGDPEYSTVTSNGGSYLYSLFTDVYLTSDNHIILNRFERPGEWSDTISIYVQTKAYTVDENYVDVLQSDWSEEDFTSPKYIDNRPAIRAGDGENSVVINYADDTMSDSFIVYLTGDANATSFSYTTNDTDLADMISSSIMAGIFATYSIIEYTSGSSTRYESITAINSNSIILRKSISTSALSNFEVTILYRYRMAKGINSTTEGILTKSMGAYSHAEGNNTVAYGGSSHTEGRNTIASGIASHAEGNLTIADGQYQHVEGKCNIPDTNNTYAHIVGNGSGVANRSNAYTLDWNGNGWYAGKVSAGTVESPANPTAANDLATKAYVDDHASQVEPEDDIVVLNLLSEFNFTTPITDADGDLIEDADNYIFLG